jgi:hypothetical protein
MGIYPYNECMKRFSITKLYHPNHPRWYYWEMHELAEGQLPPTFETARRGSRISAGHILDIYDSLVEDFQITDDTYEVMVQDELNEPMTIWNEGDWAIAVLIYQT